MSQSPFERPKTMTFIVSGQGEFPWDMLRADECWPYGSVDANAIAARYGIDPPEKTGKRAIRLTTMDYMTGADRPNRKRWESFGWRVMRVFRDED